MSVQDLSDKYVEAIDNLRNDMSGIPLLMFRRLQKAASEEISTQEWDVTADTMLIVIAAQMANELGVTDSRLAASYTMLAFVLGRANERRFLRSSLFGQELINE